MESGGEGDPPALSRGSSPVTGKFPFMVKHRKQKDHPETAFERQGGDVTRPGPTRPGVAPEAAAGSLRFLRLEQEMVNSVCK